MHKIRIIKRKDGSRDYHLEAKRHGQYASAHRSEVSRGNRREEKARLFEQVDSVLTFPVLL